MNYNRRSTRPDSLFYRDQRKIRGSARGRALGGRPLGLVIGVALLVAAVVYLLLFRHG